MGVTRVRMLVAVTTSLVALVGCSAPPDRPERRSSVAVGSTAPSVVEDVTVPGLLDRVEKAMSTVGSVEYVADGDWLGGSGTLDLATGDLRMIAWTADYGLNIVRVDDHLYVSDGDAIAAPWREVRPSSIELPEVDPLETLAQWRAGATRVTPRGDDAVQGRRLARYDLTVDVSRSLAAAGATPAPDSPETVVYEVWLDDDDLPRRVTLRVGDGQQTLDYSGWGASVEIVAPELAPAA